jgi:2-methylisocitrate lyase-like PEP mutase family enzyme
VRTGIFVPGLLDLEALRTLADATTSPVNAMIGPGAPSVAELVDAGVTRISAGTGLAQSAYAHARRAAAELLAEGTYGALEETIDYFELNADFSGEDA